MANPNKFKSVSVPIDTYKKDVDELVKPNYKMPWDKLRTQLKDTGIRNSTLMAYYKYIHISEAEINQILLKN